MNKEGEESIIAGRSDAQPAAPVALHELVSAKCGAQGFSTGTATFQPAAELPCHKHAFSEAATIMSGEAVFRVEGRQYRLRPFDCIHVPAGAAHGARNASPRELLIVHTSFATPMPSREWVEDAFAIEDRQFSNPNDNDPEHIVRFEGAPRYGLADGTQFCDLFAGRHGAAGICGGYGEFNPGSSLPCHIHEFDESITIVAGEAICEVMGRRYRLSGGDTAFVPRRRPHRFLNESQGRMAMVWVYAASEPERVVVETRRCAGWRRAGRRDAAPAH